MFSRSTDGGTTWSQPVRVNDDSDTTAWQWFGTMSVAPNGRIDVVWLDTRDYPGTYLSSLYYSYSLDGGISWSLNERLSMAFDPHVGWPQQNKMGDYFDMVSSDSCVHLAWAATFNGEQDVYYGRITPIPVAIDVRAQKTANNFSLTQNYPNPFNPSTTIKFNLLKTSEVTLKIFTILGEEVVTLLSASLPAGSHSVEWDASNLASGVYLYRLQVGDPSQNPRPGYVETRKMVLMK
jgi:hypothetical protein